MGLNISIVDMRNFEDAAGWDFCRYAGDKEVLAILSDLPHASVVYGDPRDVTIFYRPDDVEQFRTALHAAFEFNAERWNQMCDMLAEDENRGLYFSW